MGHDLLTPATGGLWSQGRPFSLPPWRYCVCLGQAPFSFSFSFLARESGSQANASERASERASCLLDGRLEARADDTGSNRQPPSLTCTPRNVLILIIYTPFLFTQVAGFHFGESESGGQWREGDVVSKVEDGR